MIIKKEKITREEFEALFDTYYPQPEEPGATIGTEV